MRLKHKLLLKHVAFNKFQIFIISIRYSNLSKKNYFCYNWGGTSKKYIRCKNSIKVFHHYKSL